MKPRVLKLSRRYQLALQAHLKLGQRATLEAVHGLSSQTLTAGLQTRSLAKLHEEILVAQILPGCVAGKRAAMIRQAGMFFAAAITPIEKTPRSARQATAHLKKFIKALSQRTVELAASNLELSLEIRRRKTDETRLRDSERNYSKLLIQSDHLQEESRRLSRQILSAHEDERKKISRELHDVIAQTLNGINIRLAILKKEAALNTKGLDRNITHTQALVERSVNIVHRFARNLRPTALDDLGLIPALHTFMKGFRRRTGMYVSLSAFAAVEQLIGESRTLLYRIAQEALTNVGRHAHASHAHVKIVKLGGMIRMTIEDNGKGFLSRSTSPVKKNGRLGILGMRERVEMVGGIFSISSVLGRGTTVQADLPLNGWLLNGRRGKAPSLPKIR